MRLEGRGEWWCKDPRLLWEESFVQGEQEEEQDEDEDYIPEEGDEDSDMDTDDSEDDGEEDIQSELQSLSLDQPPIPPTQPSQDQAHTKPNLAQNSFLYKLAQTLRPDPNTNNPRALYLDPWTTARREQMKQLLQIYVLHGWPLPEYEYRVSGRYLANPSRQQQEPDLTNFKREDCLAALAQWSIDKRERERAERRVAARQEAQTKRKVTSIARKLQKWFLHPASRHEEIDESLIPYAVLALVELEELEPVPEEVILGTKIHRVLQWVVDCRPLQEREDLREICDKASQFLRNWEYIINSASED